MTNISDEIKFQEVMSHIRHLSSLRFAIMTLYLTLNGFVLSNFLNLDCEFISRIYKNLFVFQFLSVYVSIVFLIFEINLDKALTCMWDSVKSYVGNDDNLLAHRTWFYRHSTPYASSSIYILSPIIFCFVLIDLFGSSNLA